MTDLTTQLVELAEGRLWTLQALFGPGSTDALDTRMRSTVATWAQILTGDDDHTCAQLVIDLAAWLWMATGSEEGQDMTVPMLDLAAVLTGRGYHLSW